MPGIDACLSMAMDVPGARGAAVVDWISGLALGTAGDSPTGDHEVTAVEAAELARLAAEHGAFGAGADGAPAVEDVIVTTAGGHHLLRFARALPGETVFLHLWIDAERGNLALARIRLRDITDRLVAA
ncbi:hypothetical protein [Streptomyces sp. WMMC897]|uniref:hypothetical protein n=2 Tax=unclassified Streptomyces TaxID=2593676 RepID=UPI0022B62B86|nr:hypothetical protein [Streptomyces sp. WMMC897]MCZ7415807.1 hypothetical protein [Streptomyces sp. WMMC897]